MPKKHAARELAAEKSSARKGVVKKKATSAEADPRFVPVAQAFAKTVGVTLMESKSGGMRGLMLNGKSFGMSHHGRFMLKLTEQRAAALIADGIGKPFSPARGRVLKAWIEVTHPTAAWVTLAKEAHRIAVAEQARR